MLEKLLSLIMLLVSFFCGPISGYPRADSARGRELLESGAAFRNPVDPPTSPDPWIIRHDGIYYNCFSGAGNTIRVSGSASLHTATRENAAIVWKSPQDEESAMFREGYWAPELHRINGIWYIYVAACDGPNENHRMYCLEAETDDPMGSYRMKGKVSDATDRWAIDGTVLEWRDGLYFIWSGWEGDENVAQNLYIAPMENPWTICGERVLLSRPEYRWEKHGKPYVNEAPQMLIKDDGLFLVYSASGSWTDDYCLGMLRFVGDDPLDPGAWKKTRRPVFRRTKNVYGPGHCCFARSPDNSEDWLIYHAVAEKGGGWGARSTRMQPFTWKKGAPVFGKPVGLKYAIPIPSGDSFS